MLKSFFLLSTLLFSLSAFACWKVKGTFAVDGETWPLHQKFEHDQQYVFPMGDFIVKLTLLSAKNKTQTLKYLVHEKKGTNLILVTQGEEEMIRPGEEREIFAKGEKGQPNSIFTILVTNI